LYKVFNRALVRSRTIEEAFANGELKRMRMMTRANFSWFSSVQMAIYQYNEIIVAGPLSFIGMKYMEVKQLVKLYLYGHRMDYIVAPKPTIVHKK